MRWWIIFLLAANLYGQEMILAPKTAVNYKEVLGVKVSTQPRLDGWSICHFFKGALTYEGLRTLGARPKDATTGAIAFAVLYEVFVDGLGTTLLNMEPDPRGADIADIFFDTLGIYCTRVLHIILNSERAALTYNNREITLSLAL